MAERSSELGLNEMDMEKENSLQTREDENSLANRETETENAPDDAEQIRGQIVETRREMSETIDAIQEKLSFSNISEQVKDQISEQLGGAVETAKDIFYEKAENVMNTVSKGIKQIGKTDLAKKAQQNPWALAIIGAGIGALLVGTLVSSKKKQSSDRYEDFDDDDEIRYADSTRRELKSGEADESVFQSAKHKISDAAGAAYESVSGAAGTAYEGVSGVAGSAYESVGNAAGKTYESLGGAAGLAYRKAGDLGGYTKENYDYYIEENPLAVGAVALALGAAVGFAIPLTQTENEYLGEYRDSVLEKAQATANDAIGTVKQMAGEAQKVIADEVKKQTA